MGALDVSRLSFSLPDGSVLFDDVSFRVGDGDHMALVGATISSSSPTTAPCATS